jgi:hypothetical protein
MPMRFSRFREASSPIKSLHPSPEAAKGAILRPSVFIEQPEHDFAEFGAGIFLSEWLSHQSPDDDLAAGIVEAGLFFLAGKAKIELLLGETLFEGLEPLGIRLWLTRHGDSAFCVTLLRTHAAARCNAR